MQIVQNGCREDIVARQQAVCRDLSSAKLVQQVPLIPSCRPFIADSPAAK